MSAGEISNAAYDRIGGVLHRALDGLSVEQLKAQPSGPESNPIGWLAWHLVRTQDKNYSLLLGEEEAWTADGWHRRFGLPADRGSGNGDTLEQVRAFDPVDAETLVAYFEAAREKSRRFLDSLADGDLEKPSAAGADRNETIKVSIARVTGDLIQHIGQIAYVRGLVDRHGWYGA